jgi:hypothetical protein
MSWSLIESTLEIGISKQLKLDPLEASIVTAGAQFRNRVAILMSLLNRDPAANASAIKTIKNIQNLSHRNDILHSVVGGSATTIWTTSRIPTSMLRHRSRHEVSAPSFGTFWT